MPTCYRCGKPIPLDRKQLRRRVKTGEYERRHYGAQRVSSVQTSYGMRVVCKQCAYFIDRDSAKRALITHVELIIAIAALLVALINKALQ